MSEHSDDARASVAGLVLAAGSGTRYGQPKALVAGADDLWVQQAVRLLAGAGCDPVLVTVGAAAADVIAALPEGVEPVPVPDFRTGMGASLRAGIDAAERTGCDQVVVTLVDLPDLTTSVVRRLLSHTTREPDALARASYDGDPGHPVVIGRDHFDGVRDTAVGDAGARAHLAAHNVELVECGDLASGHDADTPTP